MIISYEYAVNLSVTLPTARGTGWDYYETDLDWWAIRFWTRRN